MKPTTASKPPTGTKPPNGVKPPAGLKPVRIGCSGWNYRDWRGRVYPAGVPARRWLECYSQWFDTVEVNATFYRLATRSAVEHWLEQTPPDFCFAVKASRYLTHVKRLVDVEEGIRRFYEPLAPLLDAGRLGVTLWQLPETFHRDEPTLAGLLERLPPGRHALELRHPSWFVPDVLALLRGHDVALVLGDHPQRPFQPTRQRPSGATSVFTTALAAGAATTPSASSSSGRGGSTAGAPRTSCSSTSTTTGRALLRATPHGCERCSSGLPRAVERLPESA